MAKTKSTKHDISLDNSLNNCPIFNPKPPLESSEPQLKPCIITSKLVRSPAPLLGIIRYIYISIFTTETNYCDDPALYTRECKNQGECVPGFMSYGCNCSAGFTGSFCETGNSPCNAIYCRVPARRGLQRTAQAATRHGARDPLVRPQVDQTYRGASNLRS